MRPSLLISTVLAVGALAACERSAQISVRSETKVDGNTTLRVVETLECPEQQGDLTRVRVSADTLSCEYAGPRGAQVTLRLVRFEGDAQDALAPIETELRALLPRAASQPQPPEPPAAPTAEAGAEDASTEQVSVSLPGVSVETKGETADVRLPGLTVNADGGRAEVSIAGVKIEADETSGSARITAGDDGETVTVNARDDAAEVRARGKGPGLRASYLLADERTPADAWRAVGYEARGPEKGPLVVAVVKSKGRKGDDVFDAAKDLVIRNTGK